MKHLPKIFLGLAGALLLFVVALLVTMLIFAKPHRTAPVVPAQSSVQFAMPNEDADLSGGVVTAYGVVTVKRVVDDNIIPDSCIESWTEGRKSGVITLNITGGVGVTRTEPVLNAFVDGDYLKFRIAFMTWAPRRASDGQDPILDFQVGDSVGKFHVGNRLPATIQIMIYKDDGSGSGLSTRLVQCSAAAR